MFTLVKAKEKTANSKTGPVSATYASQASCPRTCAFYRNGCYAETGFVAFTTNLLASITARPIEVARQEAAAIDTLTGKNPLRLHIVGDCKTPLAARTVAAACARYIARFGSIVWTYTHAWRKVPRIAWGAISVLASCESTNDIRKAWSRGYAAAIVVDTFPTNENGTYIGKKYTLDGIDIMPCPQQTGKAKNCASCKLCFRDSTLINRMAIGFAAHGIAEKKVKAALVPSTIAAGTYSFKLR